VESHQADESADVLVVGGGTAGAVLPARLSEDRSRHVVLLEAGRAYRPDSFPAVLDSPELSAADRTNILGATASKLVPRFGSRHPTPEVDSAAH